MNGSSTLETSSRDEREDAVVGNRAGAKLLTPRHGSRLAAVTSEVSAAYDERGRAGRTQLVRTPRSLFNLSRNAGSPSTRTSRQHALRKNFEKPPTTSGTEPIVRSIAEVEVRDGELSGVAKKRQEARAILGDSFAEASTSPFYPLKPVEGVLSFSLFLLSRHFHDSQRWQAHPRRLVVPRANATRRTPRTTSPSTSTSTWTRPLPRSEHRGLPRRRRRQRSRPGWRGTEVSRRVFLLPRSIATCHSLASTYSRRASLTRPQKEPHGLPRSAHRRPRSAARANEQFQFDAVLVVVFVRPLAPAPRSLSANSSRRSRTDSRPRNRQAPRGERIPPDPTRTGKTRIKESTTAPDFARGQVWSTRRPARQTLVIDDVGNDGNGDGNGCCRVPGSGREESSRHRLLSSTESCPAAADLPAIFSPQSCIPQPLDSSLSSFPDFAPTEFASDPLFNPSPPFSSLSFDAPFVDNSDISQAWSDWSLTVPDLDQPSQAQAESAAANFDLFEFLQQEVAQSHQGSAVAC